MAGTMEILSTMGQMIINDKEMNAKSTILTLEDITFVLSKQNGSLIESQEIQSKQGSIRLPSRLETLGIDGGSCVQKQVCN